MWQSVRNERVMQAQLAEETLWISGTAEMLCWGFRGRRARKVMSLFTPKMSTIRFFFYIRAALCTCINPAIQHSPTAAFKKCLVKHVLERTLSQASTKQNEMHYEKGNYSETTYESCRWTQYAVEWLTRKHSRWPPSSTWTIWYSKTWGIVLINVAVL